MSIHFYLLLFMNMSVSDRELNQYVGERSRTGSLLCDDDELAEGIELIAQH